MDTTMVNGQPRPHPCAAGAVRGDGERPHRRVRQQRRGRGRALGGGARGGASRAGERSPWQLCPAQTAPRTGGYFVVDVYTAWLSYPNNTINYFGLRKIKTYAA